MDVLLAFIEIEDAGQAFAHLINAGERSANLLLEQFKIDRLAAAESPATINRRLSMVRSFFKCLHDAEVIRWHLSCPNVLLKKRSNPFARRR